MFMVLSHDQSHCESSPGSSGECRLSAGWPPNSPILRPTDLDCEYGTTIICCYHPHCIQSHSRHPLLACRSPSIERKRYWNRPVASHLSVCLSGRCTVAKRLNGSGCRLDGWVY